MSVSVTLIVRDEEQVLGRCLQGLAGAVDEIVVVDTGSVDATRDVARRYTDQVHAYTWAQDFSGARQYALERAHGDWVCYVDADDVVIGAEQIRALAAVAPVGTHAIYWPYVVAWDAYGHPTCRFWRNRLVRNDGSHRWQGRVHEALVAQRPGQTLYSDQVVVEHHPPVRKRDHSRRNLEILEAELADCGGDPPARLLFYLAREYAACGQVEQALQSYRAHQERCTWGDERYQSLLQMADLLLQQGEREQAIDVLLQGLKVCPHWPDVYLRLARIYYYAQDWHRVIHWTEMGRAMPRPQTLLFSNPMDYSYNWMIYYTNALYHVGEVQEALDWTRRALEICPNDDMHRQNLAFLTGAADRDAPRQRQAATA